MTADDRNAPSWPPSDGSDGSDSGPGGSDGRSTGYGETPAYGEAPEYGDAPTYGDSTYGDAPFYGDAPSYGDDGSGDAGYTHDAHTSLIDAPDSNAPTEYPAEGGGLTDDDPVAAEAAAEMVAQQERLAERESRLTQLFTATIIGTADERIGKVGQVYLDDQTQEPNWVTAKTGLFGTKEYFIPLDEAHLDGNRIVVPYTKTEVTSAPVTEIDQNLSPAEEDALYEHYRVPKRFGGGSDDRVGDPQAAPFADGTLDDDPIPLATASSDGTAYGDAPAYGDTGSADAGNEVPPWDDDSALGSDDPWAPDQGSGEANPFRRPDAY